MRISARPNDRGFVATRHPYSQDMLLAAVLVDAAHAGFEHREVDFS
jgi:hypothetical protein